MHWTPRPRCPRGSGIFVSGSGAWGLEGGLELREFGRLTQESPCSLGDFLERTGVGVCVAEPRKASLGHGEPVVGSAL